MLENIQLITLDQSFASELAQLEKLTFSNPWDEKQWLYELNENPVSKMIGILYNDELIAYLDYWITFDSATIAKIAVLDKYRRNHLSSILMDEMMKDLKKQDVFYVTLEVRVSNEAAINLYKKYGFDIATTKYRYYADNEDAYYMVKGV